ncbi:MAG: hypothetical protein D6681_06005 [Calditrichaeota bacterium]|nr:MAG: hypothetical protein D6681_06005 [Calditrichota bacterium]
MADTSNIIALEEIIFRIEAEADHTRRLELLAQLEEALESAPHPRDFRMLKSLLYHPDWYIRREAAFLIDRFGVKMNPEERWQFEYALQNFELLAEHADRDATARRLLFEGCRDRSDRFRSRVVGYLRLADCQTPEEIALVHYAAGDYPGLVELGCDADFRTAVVELLRFGMQPENNSPYHRKQCAFALEQLQELENASEVAAEIMRSREPEPEMPAPDVEEIRALSLTPLQRFIRELEKQGLMVDGQRVYPSIQIGSVTNRITYRDPGLQTWPREDRERRITASPGCRLIKCDYRAIEPMLLIHFLLQRFLIGPEEVPLFREHRSGEEAGAPPDIYLAIDPRDREGAKTWLNAVINGGGRRYARNLNPLQQTLWEAVQELRQEMIHTVRREGAVETIGGNRIPLSPETSNLGGKAVNRLIQGSASDVFNHAVLQLHRHFIQERIPARVYFLLYDEVWVEAESEAPADLEGEIRRILESVNEKFALLVPLTVRIQ